MTCRHAKVKEAIIYIMTIPFLVRLGAARSSVRNDVGCGECAREGGWEYRLLDGGGLSSNRSFHFVTDGWRRGTRRGSEEWQREGESCVESVAIRLVPAFTTCHHLDSRELKEDSREFLPK